MPIYEYRCQECGHELEAIQKIADDPLRQCPACDQAALQRMVSAAAFRLKGGGWYETDFKKNNKKNLSDDSKAKAEGSSDAASKSAGDSKSASESKSSKKSGETKPKAASTSAKSDS